MPQTTNFASLLRWTTATTRCVASLWLAIYILTPIDANAAEPSGVSAEPPAASAPEASAAENTMVDDVPASPPPPASMPPASLPPASLPLPPPPASLPPATAAISPFAAQSPTPTTATDDAKAIAVRIACEGYARTKACPTFLLAAIDENRLLTHATRASADVNLFVTTTQIGNDDLLHFRFVASVKGAPATIEYDVTVSSRGSDDAIRKVVVAGFQRGIALFVAARLPAAVDVAFHTPTGQVIAKKTNSPWDVSLMLSGSGNKTARYLQLSGFTSLGVAHTTATQRVRASVGGSYSRTEQPPLIVGDQQVSLNTRSYSMSGTVSGARDWTPHWSTLAIASLAKSDPRSPVLTEGYAGLGVEWNRYASNDARGNVLGARYNLGVQADRYAVVNVLGQTSAIYPEHQASVFASLRRDTATFNLSASARSQVDAPSQRYVLSLSPSITWQIGAHVDVSLSGSLEKRAIPGPARENTTNPDIISRGAYADPLEARMHASLTLHWDRSNGARYSRFAMY